MCQGETRSASRKREVCFLRGVCWGTCVWCGEQMCMPTGAMCEVAELVLQVDVPFGSFRGVGRQLGRLERWGT